MAETTGISWCDHTFNPWLGCTKVSPCCDGCYAAVWGHRFGVEWGAGKPRKRTSVGNWKKPLAWNRAAATDGKRHLVFGGSLCDPFDNEAPEEWRRDYWQLIKATPNLIWIIVTKRIGNAAKMLPVDWGAGWSNVWILITVGNQVEADRDVPKLLATPATLRGLSVEPMLGPVDVSPWLRQGICGSSYTPDDGIERCDLTGYPCFPLDWVISGGASEQPDYDPPPSHPAWHQSLADQCAAAGVPYHFKQWGAWRHAPDRAHFKELIREPWTRVSSQIDGVRPAFMVREGTKASGRLLYGKIHDAFPEISR